MEFPKLIIFDCDGTLVDSEPISNQVVSDMMNDIGLPMSRERSIALFAGKSFKDITAYINTHLDHPLTFDFESRFREKAKIAFEKDLIANPGVIRFIKHLKIPYCVASNGPRIKMETTLKVSGLDKYFSNDNIFSAYDINAWKPDPELFLYAARTMGVSPEHCLVFEDTVSGITAAENAGMQCIVYEPARDGSQFEEQGYRCISSFENLDLMRLIG